MKTKAIDMAGKQLATYDYEMKQLVIGADFCVGHDLHVIAELERDEAGGWVIVRLIRRPEVKR